MLTCFSQSFLYSALLFCTLVCFCSSLLYRQLLGISAFFTSVTQKSSTRLPLYFERVENPFLEGWFFAVSPARLQLRPAFEAIFSATAAHAKEASAMRAAATVGGGLKRFCGVFSLRRGIDPGSRIGCLRITYLARGSTMKNQLWLPGTFHWLRGLASFINMHVYQNQNLNWQHVTVWMNQVVSAKDVSPCSWKNPLCPYLPLGHVTTMSPTFPSQDPVRMPGAAFERSANSKGTKAYETPDGSRPETRESKLAKFQNHERDQSQPPSPGVECVCFL